METINSKRGDMVLNDRREIPCTCDPDGRLRRIPRDKLLRFQGNLKTLDSERYEKLKTSLLNKGFFVPVFVWAENEYLLDGHQRLNVLEKENWNVEGGVPVVDIVAENEKDAAEKLLLIVSTYGKIDSQGVYEFTEKFSIPLIEFDLPDLPDFDYDSYKTEFYGNTTELPPGDPDEVPAVPPEPTTKTGDLWLLGPHRVLCGDITNEVDVERLMAGKKADILITDPPYGVDYVGGLNEEKREKLAGDKNTALYPEVVKNALVYCKTSAPLYIWFADSKGEGVYTAISKAGYNVRAMIVWNKLKPHYGNFMAQYMQRHEPCLYCVLDPPKWRGPTNEVSVWDIPQAAQNEYHPTQKPVELSVRALRNSSDSGDLVADYFLGSGSVLIAAEKTSRVCFGLELAPGYCDVIIKRWQEYSGQEATLDGDGQTFNDLQNLRVKNGNSD